MKNNRKLYILIIFIPVILFITVLAAFFIIQNSFEKTTEEQLLENVQGLTDLQNETLSQAAESWIHYTTSIATTVSLEDTFTPESVKKYSASLNETFQDESIVIVDVNGHGYDSDGTLYDVSDRDYFQTALSGETCISGILNSKKNDESSICVASPIFYEDSVQGVVVYIISTDSLSSIFENSIMSSLGSTSVLQEDGNVLFQLGENKLFGATMHEEGNPPARLNDENMAQLEEGIANKENGYISLPQDDDQQESVQLITHTYNETTGWTIVTMIDPESFETQSALLSEKVRNLSYMCFLAIVLFLLIFILLIFLFIRGNMKRQQYLQAEKERFDLIAQYTNSILFDYDIESKTLYCKDHSNCELEPHVLEAIDDFIRNGSRESPQFDTRFSVTDENQQKHWYDLRMSAVFYQDYMVRIVGRLENIDEQMEAHVELEKQAQLDQMTGLYNKTVFWSLVDEQIQKDLLSPRAFLFIDVDNFKQINDTFGHKAGDDLLIHIANKIRSQFRETDLIGRFGGDEFVIFLNNYQSKQILISIADRLCRLIATDKSLPDKGMVSISVGIACYPTDGCSRLELMEAADKALYAAKGKGKNQFAFYEDIL